MLHTHYKIKIKTINFTNYIVLDNGKNIFYSGNTCENWNDDEISLLLNDDQYYKLQIGKSCFIVELAKLKSLTT